MTRQQGVLATWNDDRGFGFIEVEGTGERVFVHIKSIGEIATRPRLGDRVSFSLGEGRDGRPAAFDVVIAGANPRQREAERRGLPPRPVRIGVKPILRLVGAALLLGFVVLAVSLGRAPLNLIWIYLVLGALSIFNYWRDKRAAQRDERRVSERSLLGLDLVFGIIGGLLAQVLFRHKTSKPGYGAATGLITALHLVVLTLLILGVVDFPQTG